MGNLLDNYLKRLYGFPLQHCPPSFNRKLVPLASVVYSNQVYGKLKCTVILIIVIIIYYVVGVNSILPADNWDDPYCDGDHLQKLH